MSTKSQIRANRRNAQKSTGPRTSQGKTAVSQNAVKHGLTALQDARPGGAQARPSGARSRIISSESQADFDLHRGRILAELAPETPMESMLAERIVGLSWRLKRVCTIQNQTIDALKQRNTSNPLAKLTKSVLMRYQDPSSQAACESAGDFVLGQLAIKDFSHPRVLERLLMYERRIENSLYKTLLELERLHLVKKVTAQSQTAFNESINYDKLCKTNPI
jgi:hypothetical protein